MRKKVKQILLTGLAVTNPFGLTVYILIFLISLMDGLLNIIPTRLHPDQVFGFHIPGLGVIFTLILIFVMGLTTRSILESVFCSGVRRLCTRSRWSGVSTRP
ncbi:MAG: hypothetical protein NTV99_05700 [Deltaproteobacteria bacterium]|nr:hypothetical protein [Deltaproteobacteria bacterium]